MIHTIASSNGELAGIVYELNKQGYTVESSSFKNDIHRLIYRRMVPILIEEKKVQKSNIYKFFQKIRILKK